jgi:cytochrome c peroxidase
VTLLDIDLAAITSESGAFPHYQKDSDIASFKTPDLRNLLVTAPYFHDGSQETLWDAVDHYNKGVTD